MHPEEDLKENVYEGAVYTAVHDPRRLKNPLSDNMALLNGYSYRLYVTMVRICNCVKWGFHSVYTSILIYRKIMQVVILLQSQLVLPAIRKSDTYLKIIQLLFYYINISVVGALCYRKCFRLNNPLKNPVSDNIDLLNQYIYRQCVTMIRQ